MDDGTQIEIRRSARRRRTVSARREGDRTIILMPAGLGADTEKELVDKMLAKLARADRRRPAGDEELMARAARVSERWLDGLARPTSVRWVPEMRTRWGSATPMDGTIRISSAVAKFPEYVQDYLLVHELAHLVVTDGHSPEFWALVRRYPKAERAIGYLEASSAGGPAGEEY